MGYSEVLCHICGVSFNIGRIRTPDEPRSSAWSGDGSSPFVAGHRNSYIGECHRNSGCMFTFRKPPGQHCIQDGRGRWYLMDMRNMEQQPVDSSVDRAEEMFPLFYPPDRDDAFENGTEGSYSSHSSALDQHASNPRLTHYIYGKLGYLEKDAEFVEHIAGPRCENTSGCNGHNISVEEMFGCRTSQCFVRKPSNWREESDEGEDDDEDFELEGEFVLSGLCDDMPSLDIDAPKVYPERHGISQPEASNIMFQTEQAEQYAMPFHPYCLEVYKRASLLHSGKIDFEGLTSWWTLDSALNMFKAVRRHSDVTRCIQQWWSHLSGAEYLVANPLFVPSLQGILEDIHVADPSFSMQQDAFNIPNEQAIYTKTEPTNTDPFARLPQELVQVILHHLSSKDIAHIRLCSRRFRQLPVSTFFHLVQKEMPWLWECWPTARRIPIAQWATKTANMMKASNRQNEVPSDSSTHPTDGSAVQHHAPPQTSKSVQTTQTDWFRLYTLLTRHWQDLKGLRNRKRIWQDCEAILGEIDAYRKSNMIPITASIQELMTTH